MHLLTPVPRLWPDPRSSGVGLYIDNPHGLIHDPVASAFILIDPHGLIHDPVASAFTLMIRTA